ncbi:MAG TPA: DUF6600 domain-containing protein [Candidatus Dormibacteraeota bacterium]|nr:DUF6600 domain-containing protein [Candidatus Dormibacteraeota bacterium]
MPSRTLRRSLLILLCTFFFAVHPAAANSSHARIIRLSLLQGDVRFTRASHGDPLTNSKAQWEKAELNLPIRHGYVLATDNGRAEVEFENGAMAFLNENSVLEFYDLSLDNGARTTRLILRQGTASFYVNPARDDYFSVTGGDFTAQASGRANFRMDNYDDGSTVKVLQGHVSVLHKDKTTPLAKNQSLSMNAGDDSSVQIGRLPNSDDFDGWVSGREDSVVTATNAALHYTSYTSGYTSGFGDLYNYGGWYPVSGFGYCWRPFGVGFSWSPFDYGSWIFEPGFGWSFVGSQPWGWLPYHFGGWLFQPGIGWVWAPTGFGFPGQQLGWRPVTATWIHAGKTVGLVPSHPLDVRGKAPINLAQGVLPVDGHGASGQEIAAAGAKWKAMKEPPRGALTASVAPAPAPVRVSRSVVESGSVGHAVAPAVNPAVTSNPKSSIVYDSREHRFVNNNAPASSGAAASTPAKDAAVRVESRPSGSAVVIPQNRPTAVGVVTEQNTQTSGPTQAGQLVTPRNVMVTPPRAAAPPPAARVITPPSTPRTMTPPSTPRTMTPPSAPRAMTPPPAPRAAVNPAGGYAPTGAARGNSDGGFNGTGRASPPPAPAPPPAPRPSTGPSPRPH